VEYQRWLARSLFGWLVGGRSAYEWLLGKGFFNTEEE
jgi:hypothetical protein